MKKRETWYEVQEKVDGGAWSKGVDFPTLKEARECMADCLRYNEGVRYRIIRVRCEREIVKEVK